MKVEGGHQSSAQRRIFSLLAVLILSTNPTLQAATSPPPQDISTAKVADYLHAVVEADRTVYTTQIVERMQDLGVVLAKEDWESKNAIPLPAQFLHISSKLVAESGQGIRYRLISRWPIYRRNGPANEFERQALEQLEKTPDTPERGVVKTGKKRLFQAVYADKAISSSCVTCHNTHPLSPKRDFKIGDVMGAVVITLPLDGHTPHQQRHRQGHRTLPLTKTLPSVFHHARTERGIGSGINRLPSIALLLNRIGKFG